MTNDSSTSNQPKPVTIAPTNLTGRCFCGKCSYSIKSGSELRTGYCSCQICQKLHAAPTTTWVGLKTPNLEFVVDGHSTKDIEEVMSGEQEIAGTRVFRSSAKAARLACAVCGTPLLFFTFADWIDVTHSSLDLQFKHTLIPAEHLWQSEKSPWFETTDSWAPRYDTEMAMEFRQ